MADFICPWCCEIGKASLDYYFPVGWTKTRTNKHLCRNCSYVVGVARISKKKLYLSVYRKKCWSRREKYGFPCILQDFLVLSDENWDPYFPSTEDPFAVNGSEALTALEKSALMFFDSPELKINQSLERQKARWT